MLVLGRVFVGKNVLLLEIFPCVCCFFVWIIPAPQKKQKKLRSVSWFHGGGLDPCVPWMQRGNLRLAGKIIIPWRIHGTSVSISLARWWFQIFFIFTPNWGRFPIWLTFFRWVETTNPLDLVDFYGKCTYLKTFEQWKKRTGCLGDLLGMKS